MRNRLVLLLASILLIVILTACGGGTPAATTAPVNTPPPADTPTPALPALSQSVTSSNNGVTVAYPEGWLEPIATVGVFLFNNTDGQRTIDFMRGRPGGLAFQINTQPNSGQRTPDEAFDFTFNPLVSGMGVTLSEKQTVTIGGTEVIKATGANTTTASEIGLYVALKPVGEGFITFVVYLHPDEIEAQTPLIEAILASVSVTAP
jgi:hypothetical protein